MQHEWITSTLGHGEQMCRHCKVTNREAAAIGIVDECSRPGFSFEVGQRVEKFEGEARYRGIVVATYLTTKGGRRYVVEVEPQGFQMICTAGMLRLLDIPSSE